MFRLDCNLYVIGFEKTWICLCTAELWWWTLLSPVARVGLTPGCCTGSGTTTTADCSPAGEEEEEEESGERREGEVPQGLEMWTIHHCTFSMKVTSPQVLYWYQLLYTLQVSHTSKMQLAKPIN